MANNDKEDLLIRNTVLGAGLVTTFILWVSLADPINIPKMLTLSLFSAWILGGLIYSHITKPRQKLSLGQLTVVIFMIGILIAAFATDESYTAFYGAPGRSNGAISYLALALVGLAAMGSFDSTGVAKFRSILLRVGAFLAFYGFLQSVHYDPIKWNLLYSPVIGTLGNIPYFDSPHWNSFNEAKGKGLNLFANHLSFEEH